MPGFLPVLFSSLAAFVATNLDDLVILMLFFAQVNARFRQRHIVAGQYLGFAALVLASLPGFFGGQLVSKPWMGLLGFLPIALGLIQCFSAEDVDEDEVTVLAAPAAAPPAIAPFLHPQIYSVAAVTFANGGDNIGIYVPLFASCGWWDLGITLSVFFVMLGVWCAIAQYLATHRTIAPLLSRYGDRIVPIVLIGLGLYILLENQSWKLLGI
jgi:cadmium resistance transport/sequestration family protein